MSAPYELIEHTADVGVRARGKDERELFENAARGMLSIIAGEQEIIESTSREVALEGRDLEELLVSWLGELVFLIDAKEFLPAGFAVQEVRKADGGWWLRAEVRGEALDRTRHRLRTEIKAVTYHGLAVKRGPSGLSVDVIFDV